MQQKVEIKSTGMVGKKALTEVHTNTEKERRL